MQSNTPIAMARLQVDLPPDLKQRLKLAAVRRDETMSEVVIAALIDFLPKTEGQANAPN
jgi:predicted transcriptional regulator